ncbi:InlB B-repeat-containing protein [Bifidobacterium sp. ESL0790]|uniref:InlB B-repeat-containing protein n=1 Tax=Bifidobacterium sp. ESL0790 TaxID=2983233 RepID=UPI0023FA23E7|nr:InlB B-repeat-containing protein [Bifidobacterium sp. ESL0790]WEV73013.1 InlB B-repeat-containing protein [Bifidobacterium sp. ESL0790]
MGPQSTCTPASGHWLGSDHGGPAGDYIDWTFDATCHFKVTNAYINHNYSDAATPSEAALPWRQHDEKEHANWVTFENWNNGPNLTSLEGWFGQMHAKRLDGLEHIDTSHVTSVKNTFNADYPRGSSYQVISGVGSWHISPTDMNSAFAWNSDLLALDLSGWDFSHTTDTGYWGLEAARMLRLGSGQRLSNSGQASNNGKSEDGDSSDDNCTGSSSSTKTMWWGKPGAVVNFNRNGGDGSPAALSAPDEWPDTIPLPQKSLPDGTSVSRTGYRFAGWNTESDGNGIAYEPNQSVTLPLDGVYWNATLYAQWRSVPTPTITNVEAKTDGIHVKGTVDGGTRTGDKITVTASDGSHQTIEPAVSTTGAWETTFPSSLYQDLVGDGATRSFTTKLKQADNVESATSDPPFEQKLDVVAPGLEHIIPSGHTLHGVAYTSGDASTQPNRTTEEGDTITVTWPDNSTTTATSDANGKFTIAIPPSVSLSSVVHLKVSDTAGTNGYNDHNNESDTYHVRLTPPVSALPFTGGTPRLIATLLAVAITTLGADLTRRHLLTRHTH